LELFSVSSIFFASGAPDTPNKEKVDGTVTEFTMPKDADTSLSGAQGVVSKATNDGNIALTESVGRAENVLSSLFSAAAGPTKKVEVEPTKDFSKTDEDEDMVSVSVCMPPKLSVFAQSLDKDDEEEEAENVPQDELPTTKIGGAAD
jgi:hypothetical protein